MTTLKTSIKNNHKWHHRGWVSSFLFAARWYASASPNKLACLIVIMILMWAAYLVASSVKTPPVPEQTIEVQR